VRLVTPRDPELSAGIVCLDVGDRRPDAATVRRHGSSPASLLREPYLHLGPSIVTTEADVDAALQAIHALA
jgi:hypothetical protein